MKIHCGLPLVHNDIIRQDPVKDVFALSIPQSREDVSGRMSWDETAVLIAVKGWRPYYTLVGGRIICHDNGSNEWDPAGKNQFYVREKMPPEEVQALIDRLIQHQPK
jgi:pyrimidine-specific ribonucleoside hydrolase